MTSKVYRSEMSIANTGNRVALQIRLLRERAGLSQAELAKKIGTRQSAIARLEDMNYGKHSIAILHKLSKIFDVALSVEFVSFSTLLRSTSDLSPDTLTPLSYDKEFAENGEPLATTRLVFDGSIICMSNYVTAENSAKFIKTDAAIYTNRHLLASED